MNDKNNDKNQDMKSFLQDISQRLKNAQNITQPTTINKVCEEIDEYIRTGKFDQKYEVARSVNDVKSVEDNQPKQVRSVNTTEGKNEKRTADFKPHSERK